MRTTLLSQLKLLYQGYVRRFTKLLSLTSYLRILGIRKVYLIEGGTVKPEELSEMSRAILALDYPIRLRAKEIFGLYSDSPIQFWLALEDLKRDAIGKIPTKLTVIKGGRYGQPKL